MCGLAYKANTGDARETPSRPIIEQLQALGAEMFVPVARSSMGGEDFSYYLERVPGCFFFLGVEPADRDSYPALHNDRYDFTDAALPVGMRVFLELVLNWGK